jgi:hypothetical protein
VPAGAAASNRATNTPKSDNDSDCAGQIGGLLANAAAGVVRGATSSAGFRHPELIANVARGAIWIFAIIVAVNQLGIAQTLVNALFMGAVALAVIALGLAFGLGGRDVAAKMLDKWYAEAEAKAPKLVEAADKARQQVDEKRAFTGGGAPTRGYSKEE